jgi:hypothetical protein
MAILDKYSGNYQEVNVAKLSGTATPNSEVYLSQNDVLLATVKANAAGNWSHTFTNLPNGVHTIVAGTTAPTVDGTVAAVTFDLVTATKAASSAATRMDFMRPPEAASTLAASPGAWIDNQLPSLDLRDANSNGLMADLFRSNSAMRLLQYALPGNPSDVTLPQSLVAAIISHS